MAIRNIVTAQPTQEAISLDLAKSWLKISFDDDDAIISLIITGVRKYCENYTRQTFVTQSYLYTVDDVYDGINERKLTNWSPWLYWGAIWLPTAPLQTVNSIQYMTTTGVLGTWDPSLYTYDQYSCPARVAPVWSQFWPIIQRYQISCFQIAYTAGYDGVNTFLPENYTVAMLQLIAHLYEDRSSINIGNIVTRIPQGFDMLLQTGDYGLWA